MAEIAKGGRVARGDRSRARRESEYGVFPKRRLSEGLRYPARRLPHLFQIDIRTVIRMLAEIVDIFSDTGGVVPKSRTDAIQVIANVGFRPHLADDRKSVV